MANLGNKTDFNKTYVNLSKEILDEMKKSNACFDYYMDNDYVMINGECITVMKFLINKGVQVNHILTDIPYGTVQGLSLEGWKKKGYVPNWDVRINPYEMLECCFYISKSNSNLMLFSQEPNTYDIFKANEEFQKYVLSNKMIWEKNNHANSFAAKTTPVNMYEEILLFRKSLDETNSVELRTYFKNMLDYIGVSKKEVMNQLGQGLDHCFRYANRTFYIPTEKNYNALIETYGIDKMVGFIPYSDLKNMWKQENDIIFNIPSGQNLVRNVFQFKKDLNNIHPTQKPVALLEELLSIFTREHDIVLDFTSGSGSTGIACLNKNRKFIGIELDETFYKESIKWYNEVSNNR